MIKGMPHTCFSVLDQESAKELYTVEIILAGCSTGHDPETTEQLRALVAKGALGSGVMTTDDCQKTYEEFATRGVRFTQELAQRPHGVEAVFRDDSGNWFSLTQRADRTGQ